MSKVNLEVIKNYLNYKKKEAQEDYLTNWNSTFDLLKEIGEDNRWDAAKTLHYMGKKFGDGDTSSLKSVVAGVCKYLNENKPGVMTSQQVYDNNMVIATYLGLSFKKGGKDDEFMGNIIKSSQSLKFNDDWNWLMGVVDVISETHKVDITNEDCSIYNETNDVKTELRDGENKLSMVYRAIVKHCVVNTPEIIPTEGEAEKVPAAEVKVEAKVEAKAEATEPTKTVEVVSDAPAINGEEETSAPEVDPVETEVNEDPELVDIADIDDEDDFLS